jgi:hypothetical protein
VADDAVVDALGHADMDALGDADEAVDLARHGVLPRATLITTSRGTTPREREETARSLPEEGSDDDPGSMINR